MTKLIHVAAAAIFGPDGKLFLAKRPSDKHQGGLWEFPGGKVEAGEPVLEALSRELHEELGIRVLEAEALIKVPYHYPDKSVLLDIFKVTKFDGEAWGKEGQETKWVPLSDLENYAFPAANDPIVDAVSLPDALAITPENLALADLNAWAESVLSAGAKGLMLRLPHVDKALYRQYAQALLSTFSARCLVILNTDIDTANQLNAPALQLSQTAFTQLSARDDFKGRWLGVSCHTLEELEQAQTAGVNFATLSPVQATLTHPDVKPMGWNAFADTVDKVRLPVYALGGVSASDIALVKTSGGQGIAAIRGWL